MALTPLIHKLAKASAEELHFNNLLKYLTHFDTQSTIAAKISTALWLGLYIYTHRLHSILLQAASVGAVALFMIGISKFISYLVRDSFQKELRFETLMHPNFESDNESQILDAMDFSSKGLVRKNNFLWLFSQIQNIFTKMETLKKSS